MASVVFVEKEQYSPRVPLNNTSGADLADKEFAVLGFIPCVAQGAVANNADGAFIAGLGVVIQISDYVTSEDTFPTLGAPVYWNGTTKQFSNTKGAAYKLIGQVQAIKAGTVTKVALFGQVMPTFAELADVDITGVTDNDTLKYVASTGKWTNVAHTLAELSDVDVTGVADKNTLKYDDSTGKWTDVAPTFAALADVDVAGVTDNDTLKFVESTGKWTDVEV